MLALAQRVFWRETPFPPLFHHSFWEVADLAKPLPRKISKDSHCDRSDDVPKPPGAPSQRKRVLSPIAAAGSDGNRFGDSRAVGNEGQNLSPETVPNPKKRPPGCPSGHCVHHRAAIQARPVKNVRLEFPQIRRPRQAGTSIVERPNQEMLPREPLGERKVELLSHAHRWNNQHCTLPLTR